MERSLKFLAIVYLLFFTQIDAFIYDICVMRKWEAAHGHYHFFIGLGDFHDKQHAITSLQLNQINKIISRSPQKRTSVIVEDISSKNDDGCASCGNFYVKTKGGILGGFVDRCCVHGIRNITNIEYRFCRVASLAPILNNLSKSVKSSVSPNRISVGCLKKEIVGFLNKLCKYQDGPVLDKWYKKCLHRATKYIKALRFTTYANKSVADYVMLNTTSKNRLNFVKKLLTFDSFLIDAKIVHNIMLSNSKRNAIVIAGGTHIKNVSKLLQQLGYEMIYKSKPQYHCEYDSKKCLGCNIHPGGFCRKPEPVDVTILNRFL